MKAVQKGHEGAVLKLIKKFEDVKRDETTPGINKLSNITGGLQKKLQVIIDLNEKILKLKKRRLKWRFQNRMRIF